MIDLYVVLYYNKTKSATLLAVSWGLRARFRLVQALAFCYVQDLQEGKNAMIRQNQQMLNGIQVAIDSTCVAGGLAASCQICRHLQNIDVLRLPAFAGNRAVLAMVGLILLHLLFYQGVGLYRSHRSSGFLLQISKVLKANLYAYGCMVVAVSALDCILQTQVFITVFFFIHTFTLLLYRLLLRKFLQTIRRKGYNKKYMLLIGVNDCTSRFLKRIKDSPDLGYEILGYLSGQPVQGLSAKYLGSPQKLNQFFEKTLVDEAVLMPLEKPEEAADWIDCCEKWGVKFSVIPNLFAAFSSRITIGSFDGIPVLGIRKIPLENRLLSFIKRLFDLLVSCICLVLFGPLMLTVAAVIKATSPGPVIFRQTRVGLNRRQFTMYKFRSMRVETESMRKMAQKNDDRCTPVGRFIRRFSIDELPQLLNVLKGEMSLVGPRPEIPFYVDKFRDRIPSYMLKHTIKPGMTGWAQVNGLRGNTSIEERIRYDMDYIEHWTFFLDLKILILTVFKGVISKNAY